MPNNHRSVGGPLALAYMGLVAYASLYPFSDWRNQDITPWAFLTAPLSPYWTGFDVTANLLGYVPLGFLLTLACLPFMRHCYAALVAVLIAALWSGGMEALQSYLPRRVPSNMDLLFNTTGAFLGSMLAWVLSSLGLLDWWEQRRERWFTRDARGVLVLLALWPLALLFPTTVPFGLGQVLERLLSMWADTLAVLPALSWMPPPELDLPELSFGAQVLCVILGILGPTLLGYCVMPHKLPRLLLSLVIVLVGVAVTSLSTALSFGPAHAWHWMSLPVELGLVLGLLSAFMLTLLPRRACVAMVLMVFAILLSVLNQASTGTYFAQTLQTWETGRFIRFHGLVQWLGWLWPYLVMAYVLWRISSHKQGESF